MAKKDKFSANKCCQPIYTAVNGAIKDLSKEQAIEVLEEISSSCDSQIEALQLEQIEEEEEEEEEEPQIEDELGE